MPKIDIRRYLAAVDQAQRGDCHRPGKSLVFCGGGRLSPRLQHRLPDGLIGEKIRGSCVTVGNGQRHHLGEPGSSAADGWSGQNHRVGRT
jgi:hypothetical protein